MLVDPKGPYQQAAKAAMNRRKDRLILAALGGTAYGGKTGTTSIALPDAQKIAAGGATVTISKLLQAKQLLDEAEAPEDRYFVCPSESIIDLLGTVEITSADYNTVRALTSGQVDSFLGFKFIRTELVYLENSSSTTTWYCYAFCKGAVGFGSIEEVTVRLTERSDKNYAWQPYVSMDMGATRIEDEMVVEVGSV